jgi:hypothetical protein
MADQATIALSAIGPLARVVHRVRSRSTRLWLRTNWSFASSASLGKALASAGGDANDAVAGQVPPPCPRSTTVAASTMARMPERSAAGRRGQAFSRTARPGSFGAIAPDFAPPSKEVAVFSGVSARLRIPPSPLTNSDVVELQIKQRILTREGPPALMYSYIGI